MARGSTEKLREEVRALTAGRGAELVLEVTGVPEAIETGFELLRFGGRCVLAGATYPARPVALSAEQIVRRMIQVIGVYNYGTGMTSSAHTGFRLCRECPAAAGGGTACCGYASEARMMMTHRSGTVIN